MRRIAKQPPEKPIKEKKAKLKKFNLGKIKRFNKGQYRAVIILTRNQNAKLIKGEAMHGMIKVGENYYDGSSIYTWLWEGKQPCYIIAEWSIRPLSASEIYEKSLAEETLIDSQIITLRAMKLKEQEDEGTGKKKSSPMLWIGIGIVGIVVVWLFYGGAKK